MLNQSNLIHFIFHAVFHVQGSKVTCLYFDDGCILQHGHGSVLENRCIDVRKHLFLLVFCRSPKHESTFL